MVLRLWAELAMRDEAPARRGPSESADAVTAEARYSFNEEEARFAVTAIPVEAQRNPEQDVLDAIDELVDEQLAAGPTDDYNRPYGEKCPQCGGSWHGLRRGDCPGATGIAGDPHGGETRPLVAGRADDGGVYSSRREDHPTLSRFTLSLERTAELIEVLTGVPVPRPRLRPEPPTRLVVPLMQEVPWGPERGLLALTNTVIECVAAPLSSGETEYRVLCGTNHVHVVRLPADTADRWRGRGPVMVIPLNGLPGFHAVLQVEEDGTVVADLTRDTGAWIRMGFRRSA